VSSLRALVLLLAAVCAPAGAWAHAGLAASVPADGATLDGSPGRFRLVFDEAVELRELRLLTAGGEELPLAGVRASGAEIEATPAGPLPQGGYLLVWRAVSADSHVVSGAVRFGVGAAAPAGGPPSEGRAGAAALRLLLYVAAVLGVGGAGFAALVAPVPAAARLPLAGAGFAVAALAVAGFAETPWRGGLLASAGLLAAASLLRWRPLGAAALAFAAAGFAAAGHPSAAAPAWLGRAAVGLHVGAVLFWAGGLTPLWLLLARGEEAEATLRRFSKLALWLVPALLAAGLASFLLLLRGDAAAAGYGALLALKLAAVAAALGLASVNRLSLTPALAAGAPGATGRLRASILVEGLALGAALVATAVLSLTPPRRAQVMAAAEAGPWRAELSIAPGAVGPNRLSLRLAGPVQPLEATLAARRDGLSLVLPLRLEEGRWVADAPLPAAGLWRFEAKLLAGEFERVAVPLEATIR